MANAPLHTALHTVCEDPKTPLANLNNGELEINRAAELQDALIVATNQINGTEFTDEDRKFLAEQRAEVNQASKAFIAAAREEKENIVGNYDKQTDGIKSLFTSLSNTLKDKIHDLDSEARKEKRKAIEEAFNDEIDLREDERLNSLVFLDVDNSSWHNRSASHNKAIKELHNRLDSICIVLDMDNVDETAADIASVLNMYGWDLAPVINHYRELEEKNREEQSEPKPASQPEPQPETSETSETSETTTEEETDNTLTLTWDTHPNLTREDIANHIRTSLKAIGVTGVEIN